MKLDATDHAILAELSADARISLAALAAKTGLTRQSVRHRIDRLEGLKVILGYTVRLGRPTADDTVRAVMQVFRKDRMRGTDVIAAITRVPEVFDCVVLSGDIDLLVQIRAGSHERIKEIWAGLAALPGVQNITTCFVLDAIDMER